MNEKAAQQVLQDIEGKWETGIRDRHGNLRAYLDVKALDPQHLIVVQEALSSKGINFEVKQTETGGGRRVISIREADFNTHIQSPKSKVTNQLRLDPLDEPPTPQILPYAHKILENTKTLWRDGHDRKNGQPIKFIPFSDITNDRFDLQHELKRHGIKYDIRDSSSGTRALEHFDGLTIDAIATREGADRSRVGKMIRNSFDTLQTILTN